MDKPTYDSLEPKEKAFHDLLAEIAKSMRRLADLMDRELQG